MGFVNILIEQLDRSTAGSEDTVRKVLKMCSIKKTDKVLFFGDDLHTPRIIAKETGADILATFGEEQRARAAEDAGLRSQSVGMYEVLGTDGGWNVIWYNGLTEPDGIPRRLEQLRGNLADSGIAVYRTLCWLIDPSPDTKSYIERRFGRPVPLDAVLREAKSSGFAVEDFYIAPKSDWKQHFYEPLSELVKRFEGLDSDEAAGIGEINKEMYMFDLHSEEYSFVYYVLRRV
ncbi:MAG: hypothetical protein K2J80_05520 [Oscillospiraceae bacterium]|nr:hypothetical protein [Oscillospiraceae bacterium]